MILAARDHSRSVLVGDQLTDIESGSRAGGGLKISLPPRS
jgi:histidinol phosphatase-like enzyme